MPENEYWTKQQVAEYWHVHERTIDAWCKPTYHTNGSLKRGPLLHKKPLPTGRVMFLKDEVVGLVRPDVAGDAA